MTRRHPERPERALNILERERLTELAQRRTSTYALRFAFVSKHCVYVCDGAGGHVIARELYGLVRGRPPLWDWRRRSIVTVEKTAAQMRALAKAWHYPTADVDEAQLIALAGRERAEQAGMLW